MPVFDPDKLPHDEILRIDRWLVANGCRDDVALEPVTLKGGYIEYTAMCKRNKAARARMPIDWDRGELLGLRRKRLRIRIPLAAID